MRLRSALASAIILIAHVCFGQTSTTSTVPVQKSSVAFSQSVVDLCLSQDGELKGLAVNRQGNAQPGVRVSLLSQRRVLATVETDAQGRFSFPSVPTGPKLIHANQRTQAIRVWPRDAAPPSAKAGLLLVAGDETVRAQSCATGANCSGCDACCEAGVQGHFGGVFQRMLQNPWLIGAGTAAAIAIPLATDDDDQRSSDSENLLAPANSGDGGAGETPDAS